ncbi:hypothetical protein [Anaerotruncus rubiinfantis]|uniref:hypothetical protein n=1 Tax=Anaerotruncus rubiinfantis TaxID=1720200 RepID=UPI00189A806E|nr:hypothetical protein [Anaerotruncus rubiinfantis]
MQFIQLYRPFLSMLALSPLMNAGVLPLHAAKITQVDRVFCLAFLAVNHFMPSGVRENSLNKITAVWAIDIPHGEQRSFLF